MTNIILCGVGGQGTVLASKILATMAITNGQSAHTAETIGMAQRGGSVVSHVRIGDNVYSPLISKGTADMLIAFEPAEAVRNLAYLKKGGTVIVNNSPIKPVTDALADTSYNGDDMINYLKLQNLNLKIVNGDKIITELGNAKSLNIALLAAAINSADIGFTTDEIKSAITGMLKPAFLEQNLRAVELGVCAVQK